MAEFQLNAQQRTVIGKKVKQLRRNGFVPINVYGPSTAPASLQVPYRQLEIILLNAGGTNLIKMTVDDSDASYDVLARDVQRDVIRGDIKHVDFFAVDENARVVIDVPIQIEGESDAVNARKGIILTGPNTLKIEMRAINIIDKIVVNLENFPEVGDSYYVRDLDLGANARILNDPDEMILRIAQSSAARREEGLEKAAEGMEESEEE